MRVTFFPMQSFFNITIDPKLINVTHPTWDTFIFLFFIVAVILYSFFANRERLVVVLLSIYASIAIIGSTPFLHDYIVKLSATNGFVYQLGAFVGLFLLLFVLFSQHMSLRAEIGQSWPQAFVISFLQVGLLISTLLMYVPADVFSTQFVRSFFTDEIPRTVWMLAPIAIMILFRGHQSNPLVK